MSLSFEAVSHAFGDERVLNDVSFDAPLGMVTALLGPSGGGKTTLLRLAAGLERVQAGAVRLDGALLADAARHPAPEARPVGLVFQDAALFPHMSVGDNVAFALTGSDKRRAAADRLASVGLDGFAARMPHTLSGGQQQRAALARALAPEPRVILMDEPYANLDGPLRRALAEAARMAVRESGAVTLVVTHDPEAAFAMADRIAVLCNAAIHQVGEPRALYDAPATARVAEMVGGAQRLSGDAGDGVLRTAHGPISWPHAKVGGAAEAALRPDSLTLTPDPDGAWRILDARFAAPGMMLHVAGATTAPGRPALRVFMSDAESLNVGDAVSLAAREAGAFLFPAARR